MSFPFDGAAYCIDALPVSDTPVIPEPDPLNVSIQCSMNGMVLLGDTVTLTSYVDNDCEVLSYLWECDRGSGFEPVDDEVGDSVSFIASLESLSWNWRLTVVAEIVQNPLAIAAN